MFHDGTQAVVAQRAGTGGHSSEADPGNAEIANYARWCEARRKDALPTLPSSIDRERRVDPFLRCDETSVAQAARDLDLHENVLRKWVRDHAADPGSAFPGHGVMKPEQQEIERLRRELAKVKAERDILKKAAAYFAKDSI